MKLAVLVFSLSLTASALADSIVGLSATLPSGSANGTLTFNTAVTPVDGTPSTFDLISGLDFTVDGTDTFDVIHYQAIQSGEYYVDALDSSNNDQLLIGFQMNQLANVEAGLADYCTETSQCYYSSGVNFPQGTPMVGFASIAATTPEPSS